MLKQFLVIGAFSVAAACATAAGYEMSEEVAAKLATFEKTGEVRTCLSLRSISNIDPLDDRNFLVETGVNNYWLVELPSRCNGAAQSFNRLQYSTSLSSLCRGEIIQVIDNSTGFMTGSCGMGDYQQLEKIEPAEEVPAE